MQEAERTIARNLEGGQVDAALLRLSGVLESTIARIRAALEAAAPEHEPAVLPADPAAVPEALGRLTRYAEESDSEAYDYLQSVHDVLRAGCPEAELKELETSLRSYDFSAALKVLRSFESSDAESSGTRHQGEAHDR